MLHIGPIIVVLMSPSLHLHEKQVASDQKWSDFKSWCTFFFFNQFKYLCGEILQYDWLYMVGAGCKHPGFTVLDFRCVNGASRNWTLALSSQELPLCWHFWIPPQPYGLTFPNSADARTYADTLRSHPFLPGSTAIQASSGNIVKYFRIWIASFEIKSILCPCGRSPCEGSPLCHRMYVLLPLLNGRV